MLTLSNLIEARKLIESPEQWTQHAFFRNKDGDKLPISQVEDSCSRCFIGALAMAVKMHPMQLNPDLFMLTGLNVSEWTVLNDSSSHKDLLLIVDETIEKLKQES